MPYYKWRCVDLQANIQKGSLFASSLNHLEKLLFKKELYLLDAHLKKDYFSFLPITHNDKILFFRNLATLLEAKVCLPDALALVIEQSDNPRFQNILYPIADTVYSGLPLHHALATYPHYFSPLVVQLLEVGQESGDLAQTCAIIATYNEQEYQLHTKIRSALLLPALTLGCFVIVVGVIFVTLIPRFATIFASLKVPLPYITQKLLTIHAWMTIKSVLVVGGVCAGIISSLYMVTRKRTVTLFFSSVFLRIPFLGSLLYNRFCLSFFQSLAILIDHKVTFDKAFALLAASEKNSFLKKELTDISHAVNAGASLSTSLSRCKQELFSNAILAMVSIGQESGNVVFMLTKITELYRRLVEKKIHTMTTLLQPLLMVFLGFCVALLITSLYIPLFNMSLAVG